jgi:hypothetical protein
LQNPAEPRAGLRVFIGDTGGSEYYYRHALGKGEPAFDPESLRTALRRKLKNLRTDGSQTQILRRTRGADTQTAFGTEVTALMDRP